MDKLPGAYCIDVLSSKDYEFQTPGDHLFAINICKRPVRESFGLKDVDEAEIGGFVRRDHGDFSIGCVSSIEVVMKAFSGLPCVGECHNLVIS